LLSLSPKRHLAHHFTVAVLIVLFFNSPLATALDGESASKDKVSMDEVAMQIRQFKSWQILDASSQKKESGSRYFRFKLLHDNGKVKIINIDPNNPNLRRLE
jgi:hypothetical protein